MHLSKSRVYICVPEGYLRGKAMPDRQNRYGYGFLSVLLLHIQCILKQIITLKEKGLPAVNCVIMHC